VIIAIIDSGVNLSHPDLTLVAGYYGTATARTTRRPGRHGVRGVAAAK
jgi:hypothetical protein